MERLIRDRIAELQGKIFFLEKEKDDCSNITRYARINESIRDLVKAIEFNKQILEAVTKGRAA